MSLRPRYSLLTLLLLTAAIAVGVKLWRGPHRVITRQPFTPAEAAYFSQLLGHVDPGEGRGAVETESIRDGWEERVLSIKSLPPEGDTPLQLYTFNIPGSTVEQGDFLVTSVKEESLVDKFPLHTNRRLQRVIATYHAHTDAHKEPTRSYVPGLLNTMYVVTDHGAIYQQVRVSPSFTDYYFTEIKFDAISDPYLRVRIAEELATLKY